MIHFEGVIRHKNEVISVQSHTNHFVVRVGGRQTTMTRQSGLVGGKAQGVTQARQGSEIPIPIHRVWGWDPDQRHKCKNSTNDNNHAVRFRKPKSTDEGHINKGQRRGLI